MVVERKFYERIRLFWLVVLGSLAYNVIWGLLLQIVQKAIDDHADKGIDPSKAMVDFSAFMVRNGKIFSCIAIAIGLIHFATMFLLRKYSKGLMIAAVAGIVLEIIDLYVVLSYWGEHQVSTLQEILEVVIILGGLAVGIIYVVSMMKMTKPFSAKIAKLWEINLWLVVGGFVIRLIYAFSLVIAVNKTNNPAVAERFQKIQNFIGNAVRLYEIVILTLTVWMFKEKMEQQTLTGGEMLFEETAE